MYNPAYVGRQCYVIININCSHNTIDTIEAHNSIDTNINNCAETGERPAITIMEIIDVLMNTKDVKLGVKHYTIDVYAEVGQDECVNAEKLCLAIAKKYVDAKAEDSAEIAVSTLKAFISVNGLEDAKAVDAIKCLEDVAKARQEELGETIIGLYKGFKAVM